ncbi:MAG: hypothetical protein DRO65_03685 [Candidatus Altiarchaeales archaeon]|nr:MAG: hypothetical protein DRO65_03685 [Candidatus Altiarchaeales archaeon]
MFQKNKILLAAVSLILGFLIGYLSAYVLKPQTLVIESPIIVKVHPSALFSLPNPGLKNFSLNYSEALSNIVAVSLAGEGVLGKVKVEIRNGENRILMNTNPFVEPDTQYSVEKAVKVAQLYTNTSLNGKDVIVSFHGINAKLIGGESAGASITAAIIAAILNKSIKNDVVVTGTIGLDGRIGKVSGIIEKMNAAHKHNIRLFLVPKGQRYLTYYEPKVYSKELAPGFVYKEKYYVPKQIDLKDYAKELNMTLEEVSTIDDVVRYMIE